MAAPLGPSAAWAASHLVFPTDGPCSTEYAVQRLIFDGSLNVFDPGVGDAYDVPFSAVASSQCGVVRPASAWASTPPGTVANMFLSTFGGPPYGVMDPSIDTSGWTAVDPALGQDPALSALDHIRAAVKTDIAAALTAGAAAAAAKLPAGFASNAYVAAAAALDAAVAAKLTPAFLYALFTTSFTSRLEGGVWTITLAGPSCNARSWVWNSSIYVGVLSSQILYASLDALFATPAVAAAEAAMQAQLAGSSSTSSSSSSSSSTSSSSTSSTSSSASTKRSLTATQKGGIALGVVALVALLYVMTRTSRPKGGGVQQQQAAPPYMQQQSAPPYMQYMQQQAGPYMQQQW